MYFNLHKTLSYNALFNFIIAERGVGKTVNTLAFFIRDFLNNGNQFVNIRRTKTELDDVNRDNRFFADIIELNLFPEVDLKVDRGRYFINGELAGFGIALSTSSKLKSNAFPKVKNIMYDEFLIIKGASHYLNNEVTLFLELYETISRLREGVRVFFLGNATSITNPYFHYFGLNLPYNTEFKLFKKGTILVQYVNNPAYRKAKQATRFGQLIEGTKYGDYAINNQFLIDNKSFIKKKTGTCSWWFALKFRGRVYGCWHEKEGDNMVVSFDFDPNTPVYLATDTESHDEGTELIKKNEIHVKTLSNYFERGHLFFESQEIKNEMMEILAFTLP